MQVPETVLSKGNKTKQNKNIFSPWYLMISDEKNRNRYHSTLLSRSNNEANVSLLEIVEQNHLLEIFKSAVWLFWYLVITRDS